MLWIVLALNLSVTAVKLALGLATGALAIVADAFHSVVDSSSNLIALAGVWIGARPADQNHPYGHRKYETVAAMLIGAMLLVAAFEIGQGVVERLAGGAAPLEITPLTIGLMALTFAVNVGVVVYETRAGRRLNSQVLLADALHTRTDLYVTLSVIASLIGVRFGLPWLDPLVAGAVVILLVRAAFEIIRSTTKVLTDVAAADPERVTDAALSVPGVQLVRDVRSRGSADAVFVDLAVGVDPAMGAAQAHNLASEVERRVAQSVPGVVETLVHVEPEQAGPETPWHEIAVTLRAVADGLGLSLHDLHAHAERGGGLSLEMHVELEAGLTLGEAHDRVRIFERRVRRSLPGVRTLATHIEPLAAALPDEQGQIARRRELRARIVAAADQRAGAGTCHHVELHNVGGHLTAILHVTQPAEQRLTAAHALVEEIERDLQAQALGLHRVVVHVEPPAA